MKSTVDSTMNSTIDSHRGTEDAHCVPLDPSNWMADFCLEYGLPLDEFQPSPCSSKAPITAMSDDAVYDSVIQTCIPSTVSSIEKGFITQDFITNFSVCSSYELSKFSSHLPEPVPSEVISFEKPCPVAEGSSLVCFAALSTTTDPRLAPLPSPVSSKPRGLVREMSNSSLGDLSVASVSDMVIPLCDDLPFDDGGDGCLQNESGGDIPIIDPSSMFEHMVKHETQRRESDSKRSPAEPCAEAGLAVPELPFIPFKRESSDVSLGDLSQASVGDMVTPLLDQQFPDERVSEEHLVEDWGLPNILDHLSTALQVFAPKASFDTTQQQLLSPKNDSASTASVDDCVSRKRKADSLAEGSMPQQPSDALSDTTTPKGLCLEVTSVSAAADDTTLTVTIADTSDSCRTEPRVRLPRYKKEPENKEYFEVTDNDVIFGRGTGPNLHNRRFRDEVVAKYREVYRKRTNNDAQKRAIIQEMMDHVKANGRFLAKDKIGWFEVTPKAVSVKLQKMTNEYKTQSERAKTSTKRKTNKKNR